MTTKYVEFQANEKNMESAPKASDKVQAENGV